MFFASVALVAVALAVVTRRPLGHLQHLRFRGVWLLWLAVALQLTFVPPALSPLLAATPSAGLPPLGGTLYVLSLGLLVVFACLNRRTPGAAAIGLGLLLNAMVIASNGGMMPVDPAQLPAGGSAEYVRRMEDPGRWSPHTVMTAETRLSILGDHFLFPQPFMKPVVLSAGDLLIAAGIVLFFLVLPRASAGMNRLEATRRLVKYLSDEIVVALGNAARDLAVAGHRPHTRGSMGMVSSMGLGLALEQPQRKVVVLDGVESLLMNLGSLAAIAVVAPHNLIHVVWDNEQYQFATSQRMHTCRGTDLAAIARGVGIQQVAEPGDEDQFEATIKEALTSDGPWFVLAKVAPERTRAKIPMDPVLLKHNFMRGIGTLDE